MKTHRALFMLFVLVSRFASMHAHAAPGDLDPTFGGNGKVTTPIGDGDDAAYALAVQKTDGKVVVVGKSYNGTDYDIAVVRYNMDGSLDNTFGTAIPGSTLRTGKVTTDIAETDDIANGVVVQDDGKIVVVGYFVNPVEQAYNVLVVRYTTNGTLDSDFNGFGYAFTTTGSYGAFGTSVALQPDKKIVVGGEYFANSNSTRTDFLLVRYQGDGTLDPMFNGDGNTDGKIGIDFGRVDECYSVTVQPNGKIVVAGSSYDPNRINTRDFVAARLESDGSPDITFGTDGNGKVVTDFLGYDDYGQSMIVQPDPDFRIVVAGYAGNGNNDDFALVRYTKVDGSPDTTFHFDGKVTTAVGLGNDQAFGMVLDGNGKFVVAGSAIVGSSNDFAVVRYNADGTPDTGFHSSGRVTTAIGSSDDIGRAVAVQSDGKIVVAGYSSNDSDNDFAVVRYLVTSGPIPPTVTTLPATNVTQTTADLHGSVNPNGQATMGYFEYGTDPNLDPNMATVLTTSPRTNLGSGAAFVPLNKTISGLAQGTPYYYRAVAMNNAAPTQTTRGSILTFHIPPTVVTTAATNVATTTVTLNGTVNPNASATTYHFEYGPTETYGTSTTPASAGSGSVAGSVSSNLTGLPLHTQYHFKLVASNDAGGPSNLSNGGDMMFTTGAIPPVVVTGPPTNVAGPDATFNGTVNPKGTDTTYYFEYGETMGYGLRTNDTPAGNGNAAAPASAPVSGLTALMTYHYHLVAKNAGSPDGIAGDDVSFVAGTVQPPVTHLPDPRDTALLSLRVDTQGFRWRIQGTTDWLDDGIDAQKHPVPTGVLSNLAPGEIVLEFEPKTGVRVPGPRVVVLDPLEAESGEVKGEVRRTIDAVTGADGGLVVAIEPAEVAENDTPEERGQWRLRGESDAQWRNSGLAALTLAPGLYAIEFKLVPLKVPLPPRNVRVLAGGVSSVRAFYEQVRDQATGATQPELVPPADVTATAPYCFAGQFQSDTGFGSGMVVEERVVLTAAHVVFDDVTLTYTTGLQWRFQRERGVSDPAPLTPRGSYVFDSYAILRRAAVPRDGVGVAGQSSQQQDVAAVFFQAHAAGRHGFTGTLKTDTANDWLTQDRLKTLVTYPIDPGFLKAPDFSAADAGKMFRTPPLDAAFTRVAPEDAASTPSRVYQTTALAGYPGGSGGALCVKFDDGNYYPAGVYLGGDGKAVVRAIDDEVANLIAKAKLSSENDSNYTGGGIVLVTSLVPGGSSSTSSVIVNLVPDEVIGLGGGWKLDEETAYRPSGNTATVVTRDHVITFQAVNGYAAPAQYPVKLDPDQVLTLSAHYAKKQAPQITTPALPEGIIDVPYHATQVKATNAPTEFIASGLPTGMVIVKETGVISGTPKQVGTFSVRITAKNLTGPTKREFPLLIRKQGSLTVKFDATQGSVSGQPMNVGQGQSVTLDAKAKPGFFFYRWTGSGLSDLPSPNSRLAFTMTDVVVMTAEFIPNPFLSVAGKYRGLLTPNATDTPSVQGYGLAQFTVTGKGAFTGSLAVAGIVYPIQGQFARDLSAHVKFTTAAGQHELGLKLALDTSHAISPNTLHTLSGDLTLAPQNVALHFTARRSLGTLAPAKYTLELPCDLNHPGTAFPQGSSVATLVVGTGGTVQAQLILADGTKTSAGGFLIEPAVNASAAQWTLYRDLYTHQGALAGDLIIDAPGGVALTGDVRWFRNPMATAPPFVNGWPADGLRSKTLGYRYTPPKDPGQLPLDGLDVSRGVKVTLGGQGVFTEPDVFTQDVLLSKLGKFTISGLPRMLQLTLVPASGLFTGSFKPDHGPPRTFTGILEQQQPKGKGAGFLLGPAGSAGVTIEVP